MDVPRGRALKRTRAMSKSTAASIISRAVKRAKRTPTYRSKFRLFRSNNLSVFPKQMRQTLTYAESTIVALPSVVGTVQTYNLRANSMYDPRVSVGGHQPYGFDQLMAMYSKCAVIGAKVTLVVGPAGSSTFLYGVFGINVTDPTSSTPTQSSDLVESQFSTWKQFNMSIANKATLGFDTSKYFDIKDITDCEELIGSATADCSKQAYFQLWVASDTGAANQNVTFTYKVEYDALFFEPRNVGSS